MKQTKNAILTWGIIHKYNVKNTELVRISEVFKPPFVKIFRRKRLSRSIPYYCNSTSAQKIIFSGDIELNPGPENPKKYPEGKPRRKTSQAVTCETCNKVIRTNTKRMSCMYCKNETHLLYSNSHNVKITDSRTPAIWTCSKCYFRELPFAFLRDIEDVNEKTDLLSSATYHVNIHTEKLKEYHKYLSIAHLKTQSMSSTFDEFHAMINENQFDTVTLSEIWLRDNKNLLIRL